MNRIGSSFLSSTTFVAPANVQVARISDYWNARVPMHKRLSFRGTEFIFPEEIRKGILPVSAPRDLLSSSLTAKPAHPL